MLYVEPKIYDDATPHCTPNSNSDRHYGYHCAGHPYDYALKIAKEIAASKEDANSNPDPYCTRYSTIEVAIIPYPGKDGLFYVEDRSIRKK